MSSDCPSATESPPGPRYIVHINFSSGNKLPIGDLPSRSSDPYIVSTLRFPGTTFPKLHRRTSTIHTSLTPTWNERWSIANVPVQGIDLKIKVMDEDPRNHDDKLGVARISTGPLDRCESDMLFLEKVKPGKGVWAGTKRVMLSTCGVGSQKGEVEFEISLEKMDPDHGQGEDEVMRAYTIAPNWFSRHSSPLLGIIITHTKTAEEEEDDGQPGENETPQPVQRFSFTATKIQLTGPVPEVLKHQYVAFRPIIKTFYTKSGLLGLALNRALHKQYRTVYGYDKLTTYGEITSDEQMASKVLDFTSWGEGGKLYTYIITLDAEWRFTQTGKEFGIQMLSKHTMHSCVSPHVAFAGEFFIRALPPLENHHPEGTPHHHSEGSHQHHPDDDYRPSHSRNASKSSTTSKPSRRIEDYELVIDNDSGTYRPPKEHIPAFQEFLNRALPGLSTRVRDAFDEEHIEMKKNHVAEKDHSGRRFKQPSSLYSSSDEDGSISSSDEDELQTGHLGKGRKFKRKVWKKVAHKVDMVGVHNAH